MTVKLKCDVRCNGSSDTAEIEVDVRARTLSISTGGRILECGDIDIDIELTDIITVMRRAGL